jgi:sec-independent protein translocase protein TatA
MGEGIFQPLHLLVILFIALIVFGPGKLPELGAGLGKSIREFKKALSDERTTKAVEHQEEVKS